MVFYRRCVRKSFEKFDYNRDYAEICANVSHAINRNFLLKQINRTPSSKSSNFSSSSSSMATLEKKSPTSMNKLPHQQSLPTPQATHHQLQQQLSQPTVQNKTISNGESMQVSTEQQSDNSSLYSVELEPLNDGEHRYIDSDPGFGSMSSSEQAQLSNNQLIRQSQMTAEQQEVHQREVEELKQEITKLKCDKLDLLRQNVVS